MRRVVSELYSQRLFALFTDGEMLYPVFAEVQKDVAPATLDVMRREIAAQYALDPTTLRIVSHPRWAIRRTSPEGHVVHFGMLPAEISGADV